MGGTVAVVAEEGEGAAGEKGVVGAEGAVEEDGTVEGEVVVSVVAVGGTMMEEEGVAVEVMTGETGPRIVLCPLLRRAAGGSSSDRCTC